MAVAMFVLSSFSPLISIYIRESLQPDPSCLAISAMVGVGMIVGTQLITRLAGSGSKSYVVLGGLSCLAWVQVLGAFRNTAMAALSTFTMFCCLGIWRKSSAPGCFYRLCRRARTDFHRRTVPDARPGSSRGRC